MSGRCFGRLLGIGRRHCVRIILRARRTEHAHRRRDRGECQLRVHSEAMLFRAAEVERNSAVREMTRFVYFVESLTAPHAPSFRLSHAFLPTGPKQKVLPEQAWENRIQVVGRVTILRQAPARGVADEG